MRLWFSGLRCSVLIHVYRSFGGNCYFHLHCSRFKISSNVKKVLLVWEVPLPIVFVVTVWWTTSLLKIIPAGRQSTPCLDTQRPAHMRIVCNRPIEARRLTDSRLSRTLSDLSNFFNLNVTVDDCVISLSRNCLSTLQPRLSTPCRNITGVSSTTSSLYTIRKYWGICGWSNSTDITLWIPEYVKTCWCKERRFQM